MRFFLPIFTRIILTDCPICFIPHGPQFLGWNVGQSVKAELKKGGA